MFRLLSDVRHVPETVDECKTILKKYNVNLVFDHLVLLTIKIIATFVFMKGEFADMLLIIILPNLVIHIFLLIIYQIIITRIKNRMIGLMKTDIY